MLSNLNNSLILYSSSKIIVWIFIFLLFYIHDMLHWTCMASRFVFFLKIKNINQPTIHTYIHIYIHIHMKFQGRVKNVKLLLTTGKERTDFFKQRESIIIGWTRAHDDAERMLQGIIILLFLYPFHWFCTIL